MAETRYYQCDQCEGRSEAQSGSEPPNCCGQPMRQVAAPAQPLDQCTTPASAEHSRFDDMGEPCDDGRAG